MEFLFSAIVTIIAYLLVPVILSFAYKRSLTKKTILIITIANGLVVWFLFRVIFSLLYEDLPSSATNMAPATLWSIVAYFILQFRTGHMAEILSIKNELDEIASSNSTPFYVNFVKELKKELPHLSETIQWDLPQRECTYQVILDYAQNKLEVYTKLNQSQNQYQVQMQQYAKIISDAEAALQNLKKQQEALSDEHEIDQTGDQQTEGQIRPSVPAHRMAPPKTPVAEPAAIRRETAPEFPAAPFGNTMEALVELGLAKCQHQSASFQPIYQTVKQRLEADMAETEAQIRCSGKTPKEFVYQMIVDEIDHLKQVGAQHEKS